MGKGELASVLLWHLFVCFQHFQLEPIPILNLNTDKIINTKIINSPICRENGKDYQRVFDTDSLAICPHL